MIRHGKIVLGGARMMVLDGIIFFPAGQLGRCNNKHECKPSGPGRAGITWYYFLLGLYFAFGPGLWQELITKDYISMIVSVF